MSPDDGLSAGTAATPPAPALWTEVGFIGFEQALAQRLTLALASDLGAQTQEDRVHRTKRDAGQMGRLRGRQIQRKAPHKVPKLRLR